MRRTMRSQALLVAMVLAGTLGACGDDDGPTGDQDMGTTGPQDLGGTPPDLAPIERDAYVPPGGDRFVLAAGDWSMASGQEGYRCVRQTIEETIFVHEFYPIAPEGTHHTVVTFDTSPSFPDGVTPCFANTNAPDMIYGSGVGTEPLVLPEGVAVRIPAGAQILVNLHLFNVTDAELSGSSGIEVVTMAEETVVDEAEVLLAGPLAFNIPARTNGHVIQGGCTMADDVTVFAVMPHMHQLGTYMRVDVDGEVLYEGAYSFDEQRYYDIDPLRMLSAGTRVGVTCTYDNPTSSNVGFGDSSTQEMCFGLLYRYPALHDGIFCSF